MNKENLRKLMLIIDDQKTNYDDYDLDKEVDDALTDLYNQLEMFLENHPEDE